jgi:hypothetical protein
LTIIEAMTSQKRRTKGTGSVRKRGPGRWQLRAFVGTDPLTGKPRLIDKTVLATSETDARRQLRDHLADVAKEAPGTSARVATVLAE